MRLQLLILISTLSLFFIGCNDDVSRNRQAGSQSGTGQTVTDEKITVYSGIHRERGSAPISYLKEININSDDTKLHTIPDIRLDDEGSDGKNVSTRTSKVRPTEKCGLGLKTTLKEKIADCATKNADKATWDGTVEATSAEGTWKLVVLAELENGSGNYEVWQDTRTGMVWSDIIETDANWCQSSGSQLTSSDSVGENCAVTGKGQKLCLDYNPVDLPGVTWRLPTRHDYLQADIDGIRFVLLRGENTFWTATVSSDVTKRDKAWTYNMTVGTLAAEPMNTTRHVRCIGTPNF